MRINIFISRWLLSIFFLILSFAVHGQMFRKQAFFEIEFGAGPVILMGDIGNLSMGGNLGASLRYRVQDHLALRAGLSGGLVFGSDAGTGNDSRGYKYYTILGELTGLLEFWFLKEGKGFSSQGMRAYKPRVLPYLYAGGGPVYYFPYHYHENAEELDDFDPYTIMLAGGAGFHYKVNAKWLWGFQAGGRLVPNDYLDGFSPSASQGNDLYYTARFNLIYRF